MSVKLRYAPGLFDALKMRKIRNTCREFMTRDRSEIGVLRQVRWWLTRDMDEFHPFLLETIEPPRQTIGYGLLRVDGGQGLLTGGLLPEWRGKGHGRFLFKRMTGVAEGLGLQPALEVLTDNTRARLLYESLGFVEVSTEHGICTMELPELD